MSSAQPSAPRRLLDGLGICLLAAAGRLPARRRIGAGIGALAYHTARRRRRIAAVNLQLAFPDLTAAAREQLLRQHFRALGEWMMDSLWALTATPDALRRHIKIEGDMPPSCILLAPHFLGLELALLRWNLHLPAPMAFHYKPMHSALWNRLVLRLRQRFGGAGFSTSSKYALLAAVRHCRRGGILCYLPDIDPRGRKSTVYVPFLGVQYAATTAGLSRLAKAARTPVVPHLIQRTADGYLCKALPPLDGFPSGDDTADATRLNALIGEWVKQSPEQYFWLHRRFKTTPQGNTTPYD